eukprot:4570072-Pleurochrysis_carterae.AAC.2
MRVPRVDSRLTALTLKTLISKHALSACSASGGSTIVACIVRHMRRWSVRRGACKCEGGARPQRLRLL